ncbi:MAG: hypothetical protein JRN54_04855 [Nitrososphaerota archaeon]|nr:hypothetical protein [Nitrososphaerota archaeon]
MQVQRRRAVSPIVATLLLIAISVALGVVVYVFTSGLASSLTSGGNGHQLTEQLSMNAYNFQGSTLTLYVANTGTGTVTVQSTGVYYDGTLVSAPVAFAVVSGSCTVVTAASATCSPQGTFSLLFTPSPAVAGVSYTVKLVTTDGGIFSFDVVAGQSG